MIEDPKFMELLQKGDLSAVKDYAREQLEKMRPPDGTPAVAAAPTPYAVICRTDGQVFLTEDEYARQMSRPDSLWACPKCGEPAAFDDDHYERYLDGEEDECST